MKDMSKNNSWLALAAIILTAAFILPALSLPSFSQGAEIKVVTVGQAMPDFTLPVYQGGDLKLSGLKGKNVLIIFPRGYQAPGAT